jgi:hypothetical protein
MQTAVHAFVEKVANTRNLLKIIQLAISKIHRMVLRSGMVQASGTVSMFSEPVPQNTEGYE